MAQFNGQVALVTGAARGIGKAIALRLASEGADVAVCDLTLEGAQATAAEIETLGRKAFAAACDVTDYDQVQKLVADTARTLGRLDILVNNAGTSKAQPFLEISKESWQGQINVHLNGAFYCSQAAAKIMREQGYGRIVLIASVAGLMGPIDLAAYGAAKAGMYGLMRAMALELGEYGITANSIAPGPIDTDLLRSAWPADVYAERPLHIPSKRLGKVNETAHAAAFLASPEAAYVNGIVVTVDGGSVAAGAYMVEKYRRRKAAEKS